jgi:hypothetical protein
MNSFELNTPVVFIVFNRPGTTRRVFEEIKKAGPKKLFIIADAPRENVPGEKEKCSQVKEIVEKIEWDCEVFRNYSDSNMGCGKRISSGLDWVFSQIEEAIILEDDCLPHPSFFRFCQELLEYYRNDDRIMFISGDNFQNIRRNSDTSYYFSIYNHVWGWASWKRTWDRYDYNMKFWPSFRDKKLLDSWLSSPRAVKFWTRFFQRVYNKEINTWDIQLTFACFANRGLSIVPEVNLVSNIGFGQDSTHTHDSKNSSAFIPVKEMIFPLKHPCSVVRDIDADVYEEKTHYLYSLLYKILGRIRMLIKHL